ncbi:hypothetical protein SDRG_01610 [Saprolegnia diclina VS20]|uniref:Pyroglutamyl-peptidase I n=1 Tax=Saprolegnia diclina (strain VS20) TaxID=1156394 RepID=T0SFC8_SAPDV|nr:hypothetical protein SDRG_01610 [Saprolegnia diclina VS20]EQC41652.1 hypothetical protein SDRG_01610 [Saprolegnia diclina VS20]|eukprot:XP_008605366.1 hypothetical protein SDRG_01610 [Saprolegnia diclina VS20]
MKIIVTGFGQFGKIVENPTTTLAQKLKGNANATEVFVLEVSADGLNEALAPYWAEAEASDEPFIFLHMGVSHKGTAINLEQVGYNVADFRIPDMRGWEPAAEPIAPNGPESYSTNLPVEDLAAALGPHTNVSTDPGRYICNYVYYKSLAVTHAKANQHALFVHVPEFTVVSEADQLATIEHLLVLLRATDEA